MYHYQVYEQYTSKVYKHIGKVNYYQLYQSSLQVYMNINSVSSVSVRPWSRSGLCNEITSDKNCLVSKTVNLL